MPGFPKISIEKPWDAQEASWSECTALLVSYARTQQGRSGVHLYASLTDAHDFKTFILRLPSQLGTSLTFETITIRHPSFSLLERLEAPDTRLIVGGQYGLCRSLKANCEEIVSNAESLDLVRSQRDITIHEWDRIPSFHCWLMATEVDGQIRDGVATYGPWIFEPSSGFLSGGGHYITEHSGAVGGEQSGSTLVKLLNWFQSEQAILSF